jgi:lysophospholipase L1-like esterase
MRPPDPNVTYIAFGDSATSGPAERDYPEQLAELLSADAGQLANEGKPGETAHQGLGRLRKLIGNQQYPNATVLLYWEGGNDLVNFVMMVDPFLLSSPSAIGLHDRRRLSDRLAGIQADVATAIQVAKAAGLKPYVATYFPVGADQPCPASPLRRLGADQAARANEYVDMLNERIRKAAREGGAVLVDIAALGASLTADPGNYHDCNHLSSQGHALVAQAFRTALD